MPELDLSFEAIKDNLRLRLIDESRNKDLLKNRLHKPAGDGLVLTADIEVADGNGVFPVSESMLDMIGVTADEIFEAAKAACEENRPARLAALSDLVEGNPFSNLLEKEKLEDLSMLYMLTNQTGYMGAVALFYPGMIGKLRKLFGGDFYVIPSSIHEVLLHVVQPGIDPEALKQLIHNANRTMVAPEDILSDNLFICRGNSIEIVR